VSGLGKTLLAFGLLVATSFGVGLIAFTAAFLFTNTPKLGSFIEALLTAIVTAGALSPIFLVVSLVWRDEIVQSILPYPTCRKCGYDLRGLPRTTACPECGSRRRSEPQQEPLRTPLR